MSAGVSTESPLSHVTAGSPTALSTSTTGAQAIKRSLDITLAFIGIVLLSPLFLLAGTIIRLTSRGPVFYSQERVGRAGRSFHIWKFRSMKVDAPRQLHLLLAEHGQDSTPLFKIPNDPRITPVGRLLRKTSIDELPQLFNVLMGHMSLVGPRPQSRHEVELYSTQERQRLQARPGITGLWQVSGRSNLPWEKAVLLDLHYVTHWSLWLDAKILARTVGVVLSGRGAV